MTGPKSVSACPLDFSVSLSFDLQGRKVLKVLNRLPIKVRPMPQIIPESGFRSQWVGHHREILNDTLIFQHLTFENHTRWEAMVAAHHPEGWRRAAGWSAPVLGECRVSRGPWRR